MAMVKGCAMGRWGRLGAAILAALALPSAAGGQDAEVPLTIERLSVQAFPGVPIDDESLLACCVPQVVESPGHVFLWIRAVFAPPWTDDVPAVRVRYRDIAVTAEASRDPLPIVGTYDYYGFFEARTAYLSAARPGTWPNISPPVHFNAVVLVPANARSFTVDFGGRATAQVPMPAVGQFPAPGDMVDVTVAGMRRLDTVTSVDRVGGHALESTLRYPQGEILELTVAIDPIAGNDLDDPQHFVWRTANFQLTYSDGGGGTALQLGQYRGPSFVRNTTNSYRLADGDGPREETLYFGVPRGAGGFTLYFGTSPVATF